MAISCKQCGRTEVERLCGRTDCWATETNLALERARKTVADIKVAQKAAVAAFPQNFHKVASWAQANGAIRPQDKDAIRKIASESVYAAMTYAAIARSLP